MEIVQPDPHQRVFDAEAEIGFVFFWKSTYIYSQWYMRPYKLTCPTSSDATRTIEFACCEQGMMYEKAVLFKDFDTAEQILQTTTPATMKALGRQVANFNEQTWVRHRFDIVYRHNKAKFEQHEDLQAELKRTTGLIVEASPVDAIWGIGLDEKHARVTPYHKWKGLNLLGKAITLVRREI